MKSIEKQQLNKLSYYRKMIKYYNKLYEKELELYSMNINLGNAKKIQSDYLTSERSTEEVYDEERHYLGECLKSVKKYKSLTIDINDMECDIKQAKKKIN